VRPDTTFFTVADERFFTGAVCLLNSLRLSGNDAELVILDAGLTTSQRERLDGHARVVALTGEALAQPRPLGGATLAVLSAVNRVARRVLGLVPDEPRRRFVRTVRRMALS
jgi:hypothetical protein